MVEPSVLVEHMDRLTLSAFEKEELVQMAHETIHHIVIDFVLSELPEDAKHEFIRKNNEDNHVDTWQFLHSHDEALEQKIKQKIQEHLDVLKNDIEEVLREETK